MYFWDSPGPWAAVYLSLMFTNPSQQRVPELLSMCSASWAELQLHTFPFTHRLACKCSRAETVFPQVCVQHLPQRGLGTSEIWLQLAYCKLHGNPGEFWMLLEHRARPFKHLEKCHSRDDSLQQPATLRIALMTKQSCI